jgi:hypothetical protein
MYGEALSMMQGDVSLCSFCSAVICQLAPTIIPTCSHQTKQLHQTARTTIAWPIGLAGDILPQLRTRKGRTGTLEKTLQGTRGLEMANGISILSSTNS